MSQQKQPPSALSVGQAKAMDTALGRLLAPLADDATLSAETLCRYARPGQHLDRLAACAIIFEYLRFSGR